MGVAIAFLRLRLESQHIGTEPTHDLLCQSIIVRSRAFSFTGIITMATCYTVCHGKKLLSLSPAMR